MIFPFRLIAKMTMDWRKPKIRILGNEFSGNVESFGREVTRFKPGDRVFGCTGQRFGAYAEYKCIRESVSKRGCLAAVAERVESGQIKPVIIRCYRLEDLTEAHRYIDQGHQQGGVVVRIS